MKKFIVALIFLISLFNIAAKANSLPIYITIRIGFFAKWDPNLLDCKRGWGICLTLPDSPAGANAELGYDIESTGILTLRIPQSSEGSKYFSSGKFTIQEDSPIDPTVISKLNMKLPLKQIVVIKKGDYPVKSNGDSYVVNLKYIVQ